MAAASPLPRSLSSTPNSSSVRLPWGARSTTKTRNFLLSWPPMLAAELVLPTPPSPLVTAIVRDNNGRQSESSMSSTSTHLNKPARVCNVTPREHRIRSAPHHTGTDRPIPAFMGPDHPVSSQTDLCAPGLVQYLTHHHGLT